MFRQKKGSLERIPEEEPERVEDQRPVPGSNATLSNVGPESAGAPDDRDMDIVEGTSSGMGSSRRGLRGKPERGSREDLRL